MKYPCYIVYPNSNPHAGKIVDKNKDIIYTWDLTRGWDKWDKPQKNLAIALARRFWTTEKTIANRKELFVEVL